MKKLYLFIFLLFFNIGILYVRIFSNKLKKIDLNLKDDEIAIIILSLETSKSLLIDIQESFLLYTFSYYDDSNLEQNISLFTDKLDYIFMNEEYPLRYPYKNVIDGLAVIQNIQLEPNRIHYNNKTFCINETKECNFVYLTEEKEFDDDMEVIFYDDKLSDSYIETLHEKWTDVYKVTSNSYTIFILNDDYEVIHLAH